MTRRRLVRVAAITTATVILLGLLALVGAGAYLRSARLTPLVVHELNSRFAGRFSLTSARWSLPTSVELIGFVAATPDGETLLRVDAAEARLGLFALLRRTIALNAVRARGITVYLGRPPGAGTAANFELQDAFASVDPTASPSTFRLGVSLEAVDDVTVELRTTETEVRLTRGVVRDAEVVVEGPRVHVSAEVVAFELALCSPALTEAVNGATVTAHGTRVDYDGPQSSTRVVVDRLLAGLARSRVTTEGEVIVTASGVTAAASGWASLILDDPLPARLLGEAAPGLAAIGELTATFATRVGGGLAPWASVEIGGESLTVSGLPLRSLALRATAHWPEVQIESLELVTTSGRAGLSGRLRLGERPAALDLHLTLDELPVATTLAPWFSAVWLPRSVSGTAELRGGDLTTSPTSVAVRFRFTGVPREISAGGDAALELRSWWTGEQVEVERASLVAGPLRLLVHGSFPLVTAGPIAATFSARADRPTAMLSHLLPGLDAAGGQVDGTVSGTVARLQASGRLAIAGARLNEATSADLAATWHLVDRVFTLAGGNVRLDSGSASFAGQLDLRTDTDTWSADPRLAIEITTSEINLRPWLSSYAGRGLLGLQVRASGTVRHPLVSGELSLRDATWQELGVAHLQVTASLRDRQILIHSLGAGLAWRGAALGQLRLEASGDATAWHGAAELVGPLGRARLQADGDDDARNLEAALSLDDLPVVEAAKALGLPVDAGGTLSARATLRGEVKHPAVQGSVRITALTVGERRLGTAQVEVSTAMMEDGPTYAAKLQLDGDDDRMTASATYAARQGVLKGEADVERLSLAGLVPRLEGAGIGVTLGGEGAFGYRPATGGTLTFRLALLEATSSLETVKLVTPAELTWSRGQWSVNDLELRGPKTHLVVHGTVGGKADLTLAGEIDVGLLLLAVEPVSFGEGLAAVTLHATGTAGALLLAGELRPMGVVTVRPRGNAGEVRLTSGRLVLEPHRLALDQLEGSVAGGTFTVTGEVSLAGLTPRGYDVAVGLEAVSLHLGELTLEADAHLSLAGQRTVPDVSGRIDLIRGRYARRFELRDIRLVAARPADSADLAAPPPWLSQMNLDVRATSVAPVDVELDAGPFAVRAELAINTEVTGTPLRPRLAGTIEAESGTIRFRSAELEITDAVVEFTPTAIDPTAARVRLRAEGEVSAGGGGSAGMASYFAAIGLEGTLDELALEVHTDPALSPAEALALLATGRPQIPGASGGANRAGLDAALSLTSSQLTRPVTDLVADQLDNLFNLRLDLDAEVSSQQVRFVAGKRLGRRLQIEGAYERSLTSDSSQNSLRAQVRLTDRMILEGVVNGVHGAAVRDASLLLEPPNRVELKLRLVGQ